MRSTVCGAQTKLGCVCEVGTNKCKIESPTNRDGLDFDCGPSNIPKGFIGLGALVEDLFGPCEGGHTFPKWTFRLLLYIYIFIIIHTSIKLLNRFKCSKLYKSTIEDGIAKRK